MCGKFLTIFFLLVELQKCFSGFFKKIEQFMDSAVISNKIKREFLKLQLDLMDTVYFFHSANSLTLKLELRLRKESLIAIIYRQYRYITKAISVIEKSKLL